MSSDTVKSPIPGKAGEHCLKCRGVLVGEALIIEPLEKLPEGCDLHATFGRPFYAEITLVDNNTGSPSGLDQAVANEAEQTGLIFRREIIERELAAFCHRLGFDLQRKADATGEANAKPVEDAA